MTGSTLPTRLVDGAFQEFLKQYPLVGEGSEHNSSEDCEAMCEICSRQTGAD